MDRDAILRKIQSLLNIAADGSGATDGEVQNALTMARKLMAKHNIEMSDLEVCGGSLESHEHDTGILFNTRYSLWKLPLAQVMAKHCACAVMMRKKYKSHSSRVVFVGEKDNPKIVSMMFQHAVLHIEKNIYRIHDENYMHPSDIRYSMSDSYAKGFIDGLSAQYKEQDKHDPGTALMVVRPKSIDDYFEKLNVTKADYSTSSTRFHSSSHYNEGYREGNMYGRSQLNEQKALKGGAV